MEIEHAADAISELVRRYTEGNNGGWSLSDQPKHCRRDLIERMFQLLGWGVQRREGHADDARKVICEDRRTTCDSSIAPDYSFHLHGRRKFFVHTPRPGVSVDEDVRDAYLLRRFAWSSKLSLSILTDFEQFAAYDCRYRPQQSDSSATARVLCYQHTQYADCWADIVAIFSRDCVERGSLEEYVRGRPKRRAVCEVDDSLCAEMERWRIELASNLACNNERLSSSEVSFAVQKVIDRILFLRIREAQGIGADGQLQSLLDADGIYSRIGQLDALVDARYDARARDGTQPGTKPKDLWTRSLEIDDRVLRNIIRSLYDPESPYEFSALSPEVLGQVYERFLGKVVRLGESRQVQLDAKPEVKKAGGVFYTPTEIVEYIIERTVGRLLLGRTPHEVAGRSTPGSDTPPSGHPLAVLDPACGSGAFLVGTYQYLLDWYQNWYVEHDPSQFNGCMFQTPQGYWRLTPTARARILLDHVYGVDADPQAVEVTKLSLLLRLLEGACPTPAQQDATTAHLALPDLSANIKCGDSLIGRDFRGLEQTDTPRRFDTLATAFDWDFEFSEVRVRGGFDAVVGNPPYLNARLVTQIHGTDVKRYFANHYVCASRGYDLYVLFVERAFHLLSKGGWWGMIVPNKIATLDYAAECRRLMLEQTAIDEITDLARLKVFPGVGVYPYIIVWRKARASREHTIRVRQARSPADLHDPRASSHMVQADISPQIGLAIHGELNVEARVQTQPLGRRGTLHSGTTGFAAQRMAEALSEWGPTGASPHFEFIVSRNIDRYAIKLGNVRFLRTIYSQPVLPAAAAHLSKQKRHLYASQKIVIAGMTRRLEAAYDRCGLALGVQVYAVARTVDDPRYLLGLLNSSLLSYLFRLRFQAKRLAGGYLSLNKGQLEQLPIRILDLQQADERAQHDQVVRSVRRMEALYEELMAVRSEDGRRALQVKIEETDRELDQLVYTLYELSTAEIRTVEQSMLLTSKNV